jgi:putative transposase
MDKYKRDNIPLHKNMNNLRFREFYRRRLPHVQVAGATYFVTFRLKDSLPKEALDKLAQAAERIKKLPRDKVDVEQYHWFEKFDDYLDRVVCGEAFLKNEQVADLVTEAIYYRNTRIYDLISFCIMPNHVHLVFTPLEKEKGEFYSLTEILHSLKRHTARQSNMLLKQSGPFWQDESYDHVIRDETELERIIKYVLYNPVKAKLVKEQNDWKWAFCKYGM